MKSRGALANFDSAQEISALSSSAEKIPLLDDNMPENNSMKPSTSGLHSQRCFVDPASFPPFHTQQHSNFSSVQTETAVLAGNRPQEEPSAAPIVFLRREPSMQSRFIPLQKWEGTVVEVLDEGFFARLVDLTSGGVDEEAEFPLEEVSDADRPLIAPGAVFYWNIGYFDSLSGQRTRSSVIRFRRLPVWRVEELERAKQKTQCIIDELAWK